MSLYSTLHGVNTDAEKLLKMIDLTISDIPRFRDCTPIQNCTQIRVLARIGGNNRVDYLTEINNLKSNNNFIAEEDDTYDSTFMNLYFKVPNEYSQEIKLCHCDERTLKAKSEEELNLLEKGDPEALKRAQPIIDLLKEMGL